jgi:copper chaperone
MTTFDVKGMTCGHCVRAVTNAVHAVDAQASVDIDLANGTVRVESTQPPSAIEHAIEEAGYAAKARTA